MTRVISGGLVADIVLFGVGAAFHLIVLAVLPGLAAEYARGEVFRAWAGPTRAYMAAHPFAFGFVFAAAYAAGREARGSGAFRGPAGGAGFGLLLAAAGALPVYLLVFAAVRLPASVAAAWAAQTAAQYLAAGAAVGAVWDRTKWTSR